MCRRTPWKYNFCLSQQAPHLAAPPNQITKKKKTKPRNKNRNGESYVEIYTYISEMLPRCHFWPTDRCELTECLTESGPWLLDSNSIPFPIASSLAAKLAECKWYMWAFWGGLRGAEKGDWHRDWTVLSVILEPHKAPKEPRAPGPQKTQAPSANDL